MSIYKVCDYVTLTLEDADVVSLSDNTYTWYIPQSAYKSNKRSQVATIQTISGGFEGVSNGIHEIAIEYLDGAFNSYSSSKQAPIIGICRELQFHTYTVSGTDVVGKSFDCVGTGEVLINARPQQIKLKFLSSQNTAVGNDLAGRIALKFSYYDAIGTAEAMNGENTDRSFV